MRHLTRKVFYLSFQAVRERRKRERERERVRRELRVHVPGVCILIVSSRARAWRRSCSCADALTSPLPWHVFTCSRRGQREGERRTQERKSVGIAPEGIRPCKEWLMAVSKVSPVFSLTPWLSLSLSLSLLFHPGAVV